MPCEEPTPEELCAELEVFEAELARLLLTPAKFTVHGQTIDNTERIKWLRWKIVSIKWQISGRSIFQGPDLVT